MRNLTVTMIVTCLVLGATAIATAQNTSDLVQASLLANASTIKPGEPFAVGVLLKIKPGWHVYWTNPGDAGLPTRVQWILPPGYTASELRFPVPEHLDQPGGIVCFGYTDEVMLTSTITPPSQSSASDSTAVDITAKVNWLCCSENCVPGKTILTLQLMTGDKSIPDNTQLFEQWQNRLPTRTSAPAAPLDDSENHRSQGDHSRHGRRAYRECRGAPIHRYRHDHSRLGTGIKGTDHHGQLSSRTVDLG